MWVVFRPLQTNPQKKKSSKQTVAKSFYSWFKLDIRLLQLLGCWIFAPIPKICRENYGCSAERPLLRKRRRDLWRLRRTVASPADDAWRR